MFAEDLSAFFDVASGFAVVATVAGATCAVIYERAALVTDEQVLAEHSVLLPGTQAAATGQTVLITSGPGAGTYRIRQVLPEPPDGAVQRLVLAKG